MLFPIVDYTHHPAFIPFSPETWNTTDTEILNCIHKADQKIQNLSLLQTLDLYSPATLERVAVEAGAGEVVEDRARLLEFQIGP